MWGVVLVCVVRQSTLSLTPRCSQCSRKSCDATAPTKLSLQTASKSCVASPRHTTRFAVPESPSFFLVMFQSRLVVHIADEMHDALW